MADQWWVASGDKNSNATKYLSLTTNASDPDIIAGPYTTEAAAKTAEAQIGTGGSPSGLLQAAEEEAGLENPLTGLSAIGDFFQRLTQAHTWERIGEVILGLVLIAVGVAHITHVVPLATQVAKAAAVA